MELVIKINYKFNLDELNNIKKQIKELGYSYRKLSKIIGICPSYIADLLNGKNLFTNETLKLFSSAGIKFI